MHLGETVDAWAELFADYETTQPFPQLGRPVFRLPARERDRLTRNVELETRTPARIRVCRRRPDRTTPRRWWPRSPRAARRGWRTVGGAPWVAAVRGRGRPGRRAARTPYGWDRGVPEDGGVERSIVRAASGGRVVVDLDPGIAAGDAQLLPEQRLTAVRLAGELDDVTASEMILADLTRLTGAGIS